MSNASYVYATRRAAAHVRAKNEVTVSYLACAVRNPEKPCLYSSGAIIPAYPHTCGSTVRRYTNVFTSAKVRP